MNEYRRSKTFAHTLTHTFAHTFAHTHALNLPPTVARFSQCASQGEDRNGNTSLHRAAARGDAIAALGCITSEGGEGGVGSLRQANEWGLFPDQVRVPFNGMFVV